MTQREFINETTDGKGNVIETKTIQVDTTVFDNRDQLRARASHALTTNAAYLAQPAVPASPTNAQLIAAVRVIRQQVDALTRQANGLIRIELSQLDDITDS